jgi:hypothetical protein
VFMAMWSIIFLVATVVTVIAMFFTATISPGSY